MTDDLEAMIREVRAATEPPSEEGADFEAPWQARAFAIAVAFRREDEFPWAAFQERLAEELADMPSGAEAGATGSTDDADAVEATFYEAWLRALERLLVADGVVEEAELAERAGAFAAGERDASEFVVGDHGHDHSHDGNHDHAHADVDDHRH